MAFTNDHAYVGTCAIIQNEKGEILLMKRAAKTQDYPDTWCLTGGFMEWGETPEEGLKREVMEEIGIELKDVHFIGRYYSTPHPRVKLVITLPFYAKIASGVPHAAQPEESGDVQWFRPEKIPPLPMAYDQKQILRDEGLI